MVWMFPNYLYHGNIGITRLQTKFSVVYFYKFYGFLKALYISLFNNLVYFKNEDIKQNLESLRDI